MRGGSLDGALKALCLGLVLASAMPAGLLPAAFPDVDDDLPRTKMAFESSLDCNVVTFGLEVFGSVDATNVGSVEYWTFSDSMWALMGVATAPGAGDWPISVRCHEHSCGWAGTFVEHAALINLRTVGKRDAPRRRMPASPARAARWRLRARSASRHPLPLRAPRARCDRSR
jgi:hypothetical protein